MAEQEDLQPDAQESLQRVTDLLRKQQIVEGLVRRQAYDLRPDAFDLHGASSLELKEICGETIAEISARAQSRRFPTRHPGSRSAGYPGPGD
jgi:hypothetical protein